jgi:hypothetical protein
MKFECGPEWDTRVVNIEPKGKIGIMITGGIDSWLLYNLLGRMLYSHQAITLFLIKKYVRPGIPGQEYYNVNAPELISGLTGRDDLILIDKFIEYTKNDNPNYKPWDKVIEMSIPYILEKYNIDELYNGSNVGPPTDYFPEFLNSSDPQPPLKRWNIPNILPWSKIKCPFLHLYKYHIIDLANKNNIDLSHTHSCGIDPIGHCGECWQCLEKQWGYKQLEGEV